MRDAADDPRAAFLKSLPRKTVEIKATLGALIADPRSSRMRDELRRRVHTVYSLARSYQLPSVCDGLKLILDVLDGARAHPVLPRAQLDRLAALVASLSSRAALDTREGSEATAMALPQGTRSDLPSTRTLFPPALQDLPPEPVPGSEAVPGAEPAGVAPTGTSTVPPPALTPADDRAAPGRRTTRSYPAISAARSAVAAPTPGAPIQVLLCGAAARATSLLEACGHNVEVAFTRAYEEAVTRARETAPDVIVAELDPPADGVALLDALKSDPVTKFSRSFCSRRRATTWRACGFGWSRPTTCWPTAPTGRRCGASCCGRRGRRRGAFRRRRATWAR